MCHPPCGKKASPKPYGHGVRLTPADLKAQFGKKLGDAAAALGICETTLKHACRRAGIMKWPRCAVLRNDDGCDAFRDIIDNAALGAGPAEGHRTCTASTGGALLSLNHAPNAAPDADARARCPAAVSSAPDVAMSTRQPGKMCLDDPWTMDTWQMDAWVAESMCVLGPAAAAIGANWSGEDAVVAGPAPEHGVGGYRCACRGCPGCNAAAAMMPQAWPPAPAVLGVLPAAAAHGPRAGRPNSVLVPVPLAAVRAAARPFVAHPGRCLGNGAAPPPFAGVTGSKSPASGAMAQQLAAPAMAPAIAAGQVMTWPMLAKVDPSPSASSSSAGSYAGAQAAGRAALDVVFNGPAAAAQAGVDTTVSGSFGELPDMETALGLHIEDVDLPDFLQLFGSLDEINTADATQDVLRIT